MKNDLPAACILITGGTSGLGLELVRLCLKNGFHVISMGRQQMNIPGYEDKLTFYRVDFNDLTQVAKVTLKICENHRFSKVVNNAGILSPPVYTNTVNGYEASLQVNYLAHLLINEMVIRNVNKKYPLRIAVVTSPLYKVADKDLDINYSVEEYTILKAYSSSKLFLILMCRAFSFRHPDSGLQCFSYNPGIFRSGIYRMQKKWFWRLYSLGSVFMRSASSVANSLLQILSEQELKNGYVYSRNGRSVSAPFVGEEYVNAFMKSSYDKIDQFLKMPEDKN